jgi:hypothetical protein
MKRLSKRVWDFNKEILLSELGSIVCGTLAGIIAAVFFVDVRTISVLTVVGVSIGSSVVWLVLRIIDTKRRGVYSKKKVFRDLEYFVPGAIFISVLFVYPTIFFGTKALLEAGIGPGSSAFVGTFMGIIVYMGCMNVYRIQLERHWNIWL